MIIWSRLGAGKLSLRIASASSWSSIWFRLAVLVARGREPIRNARNPSFLLYLHENANVKAKGGDPGRFAPRIIVDPVCRRKTEPTLVDH
jgi:hypothetical protein